MKIKKFNERHVDEIEDGLEDIEQWTNSLGLTEEEIEKL